MRGGWVVLVGGLCAAACESAGLSLILRDAGDADASAPAEVDASAMMDASVHDLSAGVAPQDLTAAADLFAPNADMTVLPRRVFVTSTVYTAALGGLTGADAKCQAHADAAALGGTYRAWLSDHDQSPSSRFVHSAGPYVLVSGAVIATSWSELTSVPLRHAINQDERGQPPPGTSACGWATSTAVWSNTRSTGELFDAGETCGEWTDATGVMSAWGSALSQTDWSLFCNGGNSAANACGASAALYCFEQ